MIYVQTNIVLQPGKMDAWLENEKERALLLEKSGVKRIGSWSTTIGNTNEVTLLAAYEDLGQYQKVQAALRQNKEFQAYLKKTQEFTLSATSKIMSPTPGSPMK